MDAQTTPVTSNNTNRNSKGVYSSRILIEKSKRLNLRSAFLIRTTI